MIQIVEKPIDPEGVIQAVSSSKAGAVVTFDGRVRDHSRGKKVTRLSFEAYGRMAEAELAKIREEALQQWPVEAVAVVHRIGHLEIGESSVFIAVSAPHRADAFAACRYVIDTLKERVPIWKKEFYEGGETWITDQP